MNRCLIAILYLVLASSSYGQTAGMLSFQGLIRDSNGDLVNGTVDLEFRIFDAPIGGNLVDMNGDGLVQDVIGQDAKQQLDVPVVMGVVATKFGPVSPKAFDGSSRWLDVRVNETPLSRIEMATAPATAEQLNRFGTGEGVVHVGGTGNVGIGTVTPSSKLHINMQGSGIGLRIGNEGSTKHNIGRDIADAGRLATVGPNGFENCALGSITGNGNHGIISVSNAAGGMRAAMNTNSSGVGEILVRDTSGISRAWMTVVSSGAGFLITRGPNSNANCIISSLSTNDNHGGLSVFNSSGVARAGMVVDSSGSGVVFGDTKSFRIDHPNDDRSEIWYASLEGPEAAAYVRGRAMLQSGQAKITLPEHFVAVANLQTSTVMFTPRSVHSKGLALVEQGKDYPDSLRNSGC